MDTSNESALHSKGEGDLSNDAPTPSGEEGDNKLNSIILNENNESANGDDEESHSSTNSNNSGEPSRGEAIENKRGKDTSADEVDETDKIGNGDGDGDVDGDGDGDDDIGYDNIVAKSDLTDDKASVGPNTVGRRGDPRMHKAVAARLGNPNLSLLDALIVGGFQFPNGTEGDGRSDRNIYDSDNVLLCQRKNQLSRRLRLAKQRSGPESGGPEFSIVHQDQAQVQALQAQARIEPVAIDQHEKDLPSFSTSSNAYGQHQQHQDQQQRQGLKRLHDGTGEQQFHPSHRIIAERSQSDCINTNTMQQHHQQHHQQQQQPNLSAFLQQQVGLQQNVGYFGGNRFMNMPQQGYGNPFIAGQIPLGYGLNQIQPQGFNGPMGQPNGQSPLDRYLELAASSMGINAQQMLFAQSNYGNAGTTNRQQIPHQTPEPSTDSNGVAALPPMSQSSISQNNIDTQLTANKDPGNKESDQDNSLEAIMRRSKQLDYAVKIFNMEKSSLQNRCLIMAGFSQEDLQNKNKITRDFEELLKETNHV